MRCLVVAMRRACLVLLLATCDGLRVGAAAPNRIQQRRAPAPAANFFENLATAAKHLPVQQMIDQRVARVSHILMKPGGPMSLDDAKALFESYKNEINDDAAKFAEYAALHSEDETTAAKGGSFGCVTRLKQLPPQLDDVVFVKDPVPGVKGPLVSRQGLHLVYLHSCGEPMGRTEALFSPPPGLQRKLDEAIGKGPGGP